MAKTKKKKFTQQTDGLYLFKLVIFLLLGSIWIKVTDGTNLQIPIPVGFVLGLLFAVREHVQSDRKIQYAVLVLAMFFGYFAPYGIYIAH